MEAHEVLERVVARIAPDVSKVEVAIYTGP